MPSLNLKSTVVLDDEDMQHVRSADEILHEVVSNAEAMGIVEIPKPSGIPEPLSDMDVDGLSDRELGALLTSYVAYAQYLNTNLAKINATHKIAEANLKHVRAKLKVKLKAKNMGDKEAENAVQNHPVFLDMDLERLKLYAMKEILDAHFTAYDKQAAALSRNITLRGLTFEKSQREDNVGNIRKTGNSYRGTRKAKGPVRDGWSRG